MFKKIKQMDITKRNKMINLIVLGVLFGLIIIIVPCIVCGVFTPLVNFIKALDTHVTAPTLFGWYHFLCVFLVIGITALLIIFKRNTKESDYRFIVFSGWYIILWFEILKQIFVSFSIKEGVAVLEYHWDAFPFQFCSTPLYTLPFIALLKHSKIRDYLEVFTMIFVFIGGIANIAYPVQVYSTCLFLDIQTMVHHGLMVILAVYLAVYNRAKLKFNNYLGAFLVFIVMVCIAIALNELVFYTVDLRHYVFNMFFISRHFPCTLPILNLFINNLPYPVLLIVYIGGFVLLAWVLLVIYSAIINHHVKPCLPSFKFKKPKTQN